MTLMFKMVKTFGKVRILTLLTLQFLLLALSISSFTIKGAEVLTPGEFQLSGSIEGFDPDEGFDILLVYGNGGILFDWDNVEKININEDGTFSTSFLMDFPCQLFINLDNVYLNFYAEPFSEMFLTIDYRALQRYIESDSESEEERFDGYTIEGPLAEINQILKKAPTQEKRLQYSTYRDWMKSCLPEEIRANILQANALWAQDLKDYIDNISKNKDWNSEKGSIESFDQINLESSSKSSDSNDVTSCFQNSSFCKAARILSLEPFVNNVDLLSRYLLNRAMGRIPQEKRGRIDPEYYDFLKEESLGDITLFATSKGGDIQNDIEFSFLAKRLAGDRFSNSLDIDSILPQTILRANVYKEFFHTDTLPLTIQSVIANHILTTIELSEPEKNTAYAITDSLTRNFITYPLIAKRLKQRIDKIYNKSGYELADSPGEVILKNILEPYKGRIVVIDFWGTTCGPCIAGIKANLSTINEYTNDKDIKYLFITDELSSPNPHVFELFVNQFLENQTVLRLNKNDFAHIAAFLGINAIPRYIIIGKDGRVMEENALNPYSASTILQKYN